MFDAIFNGTMYVMDWLLSWMLNLPLWSQIVIVAFGTSAILTFARPFTTNQNLLRRCKQDKKRLGELIRQAKITKDKPAIVRYRQSIAGIGMKTMKAEFKPLLLAIIPLAALGTWCFSRLGYVPPKADEPQKVNIYVKSSAIGKTAHLVPQEGIACDSWMQRVASDPQPGPDGKSCGLATWNVRASQRNQPYQLVIRSGDQTVTKELIADGKRYGTPIEMYDGSPIQAGELALTEYKPFGFIPGVPFLMLQPWIVAYLLLTIPFVFTLRWISKIN